jgi:hypothetical protein
MQWAATGVGMTKGAAPNPHFSHSFSPQKGKEAEGAENEDKISAAFAPPEQLE